MKPEVRERQDLLHSDQSDDDDSEVGIGDLLASTAQVLDEERHERLKEVTLGIVPGTLSPYIYACISYQHDSFRSFMRVQNTMKTRPNIDFFDEGAK